MRQCALGHFILLPSLELISSPSTCIPSLQPMSLTSHLRMLDMTEIPSPEPDTRNISTNSRLRLKYWPTMRVAVSLAIPTPTPRMMP